MFRGEVARLIQVDPEDPDCELWVSGTARVQVVPVVDPVEQVELPERDLLLSLTRG